MIETKQEKQDPRGLILAVILLVVGLGGVGGVLYWFLAPQKQRQVKLTEDQTKQVDATGGGPVARGPAFPPAAPLPVVQDPGPTMVTLDLKNVLPQFAITELAKQAKVQISSAGEGPSNFLASLTAQRVNVSVANQPFWVALREICRQGNLTPYSQYDNKGQITLMQGQGSDLKNPTISSGSTMLVLSNVTSTFESDVMSGREASRSLDVNMMLYVEPKISPYRITPMAVVETAVDESGTSLIRPPQQWDDRGSSGNERSKWMRNVVCRLQFPPNAGERIAKLKGYVSVILAGPPQTVTVKDPLKAKNLDQKIDATVVRVMSIRKQGNNMYEAYFAGESSSPVFKDWETFSHLATMRDAKGKKFSNSGGGWGGGSRNTMEYSVYFQAEGGAGEPTDLDITVPTQLRELRIPFDFTDLPLPH
jgi:hypothetical protein